MRTLKFIVDGQLIKKDPNCDFSNLVPGSQGYLRAEFTFSKEWDGCVKAASFYSIMGREYAGAMLADGKSCMIPAEACKKRSFKIQVKGRKDGFRLETSKVTVNQTGGAE